MIVINYKDGGIEEVEKADSVRPVRDWVNITHLGHIVKMVPRENVESIDLNDQPKN